VPYFGFCAILFGGIGLFRLSGQRADDSETNGDAEESLKHRVSSFVEDSETHEPKE